MRIVLDTNVLISGLITPGRRPPARLLDGAILGAFTLITSTAQLAELQAVLDRPRLQRYVLPGAAAEMLASIDGVAEIHESPLPEVRASPDPQDDMILATALAGGADLIVSGDQRGLIGLGSFEGIEILEPAAAIEFLRGGRA